jgi:uncharacterized membrane protein YGL010W
MAIHYLLQYGREVQLTETAQDDLVQRGVVLYVQGWIFRLRYVQGV